MKPLTREESENAVRVLLRLIGRDPDKDEGVKDTPRRVVDSLYEMTCGRYEDPKEILKTTFEVQNGDQIIILKDIPFDSLCEHHLLPFSGTVDIGYLPAMVDFERRTLHSDGPDTEITPAKYAVVGLSKLARLVDCFANRTQLQERMTRQIAEVLETHLKARGVAVVVKGTHSCMSCRGVKKSGSTMITSCMLGLFLTEGDARQEFLELCRQG